MFGEECKSGSSLLCSHFQPCVRSKYSSLQQPILEHAQCAGLWYS
jgi:hypothetical protein